MVFEKRSTMKVQLWDNMQYYFKEYNDVTMRAAIFFDGEINYEILKKAVSLVANSFPILKTKYVKGILKAHWEINDDKKELIEMFLVHKQELRPSVERYISKAIDAQKDNLFKVAVFRKEENEKNKDCLVFLMSHMVADGSGFMLFMKAVSEAYNNLQINPNYKCRYNMGNRDYKQFYEYLTHKDIKRARKMTNYRYTKNQRTRIPFSKEYDPSFERKILTRRVDGFSLIRKFCKNNKITFNDIILAAYFRVLSKYVNLKGDETLSIDCILNLRRYMPTDTDPGFCNLVSKIKVNVGKDIGREFLDTCRLVHDYMEFQKENLAGLGGLSLLNLMDKIFPFAIGNILIKIFYQNPFIALSNIGQLDKKCTEYDKLKVMDIIMTGTVKYPPYVLLSLITYEDSIFFAIAEACSDEDFKLLNLILDDVAKMIASLK